MSLNRFLTRLIALCIAPLVVLAAYLAYAQVQDARHERDTEAMDRVKNVAIAIDQNLRARIRALQVLAGSPLADGASRRAEFYREAQGFEQSFGSHVLLAETNFRILFNTAAPYGTALGVLPRPKGRAAAPLVLETGKPAVGDLFIGNLVGRPLVAVAVPVLRQGVTTHLLLTVIDTEQYQQRLEQTALRPGWSVQLLDSSGGSIARRLPAAGPMEVAERFTAKLETAPWTVVIGISRDAYNAPIVASVTALILAILGATVVGALGAQGAGRRLSSMIRSLAAPRENQHGPEIDEVANARRLIERRTKERDEAETERRDAEERYRLLFEIADDGVLLTAPEGHILAANPAACRMFGRSEEALRACSRSDVVDVTDPRLAAALQERERTGRFAGELTLLRGDGTAFPAEVSTVAFKDSRGQARSAMIIRDVSARRSAEAELRVLSHAVAQSPSSIVITDRDGNIEYVNPHFEQVTGYTRAEALGRNPRILKSGNTPPETYEYLWKAIAAGGQWRGELCNRRKNGELFWEAAAISGLKNEAGEIEHYVAIKDDITDRKAVEARLVERERLLSDSQAVARVGSWMVSVASGEVTWSDETFRLYGLPPGTSKPLAWNEYLALLHPDDRPRMQAWADACSAGQQPQPLEFRIRMASGEDRWLLGSGVLEYGADGKPWRRIGTVQDITERKRLEEVHLRAQKMESLGTLAGGIAHDFNNILSAIQGNADLAVLDVPSGHPAAESLEEIRRASARARELVRRITAFARPKEAQREVVDLSVVVNEVLKLLRSTLPAAITLDTRFDGGVPNIHADTGQMHEAIVNLTTNAAYAIGPRSGTISYWLSAVDVDEELVRRLPGLAPGLHARLTVSDSGSGMRAETVERIFDAFYTTKPVGEGTGLGLSMVHGIVRNHGGAIVVESAPGKGSSFHLYFPAAEGQSVKPGVDAVSGRAVVTGKRVLYLDDEKPLVYLATRMLKRMGHTVSGYSDPEAALSEFFAHQSEYDLLITDLSMPTLSGFEVARRVLEARPDLPILMTTGYVRPADEEVARGIGIREFLVKPVTADDMTHALDRLFGDQA